MDGKNPWICRNIEEILNKKLLQYFKGERSGYIQVEPKKFFFPEKFARGGEKYFRFEPRPTDTWVLSFPRSGTTWTQEMVWLLGNDLDFSKSSKVPLVERFPFLEFDSCVHEEVLTEFLTEADDEETRNQIQKACGPILDDLESITEPRFIKSHLPFSLLHPELLKCGARVIYVARNPKDVAVSFFHFHRFIKTLDYGGDFENFWKFFQENLIIWAPYWEHLSEAWEQRDNPNFLFLFYEDLKKDLRRSIKKVSTFLGKEYKESDIENLVSHLDFNNFKNNQSVNMEILGNLGMLSNYNHRCIRQGKIGGWRGLFTPELNNTANKWIKKHLDKLNITFPNDDLFLEF